MDVSVCFRIKNYFCSSLNEIEKDYSISVSVDDAVQDFLCTASLYFLSVG